MFNKVQTIVGFSDKSKTGMFKDTNRKIIDFFSILHLELQTDYNLKYSCAFRTKTCKEFSA